MKIKEIFLVISVLFVPIHGESIASENGVSYIDGSKSFLEIGDVNRQAEAWAMCAAAYDVMAEILVEAQPARSKQLSDLANGAELAVTMSMVADGLDSDMSANQFNSLWAIAKLAGTELPKTRKTMLAAEAESASSSDIMKFIANVTATVAVCAKNLPGQQTYIDTWRELAKSGLLQLPND